MHKVVSVSLGSRHRDHGGLLTLLGHEVQLIRHGTDGDWDEAKRMITQIAREHSADVVGLGGIDRFLHVGSDRYEIVDARGLADAAGPITVVDGSGLKDTWERDVVASLVESGYISRQQKVLMVAALDRFGMAETFFQQGFDVVAGDLIFGSRINYPIHTLEELYELGRKLLPEMVKLPFHQLYPVGHEQRTSGDQRFAQYFEDADIIAGDFHYIRRYMPPRLDGKTIVTNTTTAEDVQDLASRGIRRLIATTPLINGRTFGTNVVEAALVAVSGVSYGQPEWASVVRGARLTFFQQEWERRG